MLHQTPNAKLGSSGVVPGGELKPHEGKPRRILSPFHVVFRVTSKLQVLRDFPLLMRVWCKFLP